MKKLIHNISCILYFYDTRKRQIICKDDLLTYEFDEHRRINKLTGHTRITISNIIAK